MGEDPSGSTSLAKKCLEIPWPHEINYGNVLTYPGVLLARLLLSAAFIEANPAFYFHLSRVCQLGIMALVLFYFLGLHLSKEMNIKGGHTIGLLFLTPISVQQSLAINGDMIVMAFTLMTLQSAQEDHVPSHFCTIILLIMGLTAVATKPVLAPIVGVALLIVGYRSWNERIITLPFITFLTIFFASIYFGIRGLGAGSANPNMKPGLHQMDFILAEPHKAFRALWGSTLEFLNPGGLFEKLGWVDIALPSEGVFYFLCPMILAVVLDAWAGFRTDSNLSRPGGSFLLGGVYALGGIGFGLAVSLALYMGYTPYGYSLVYGLQSRYFIPSMACILIAIFPMLYVLLKQANDRLEARFVDTNRILRAARQRDAGKS